MFGLSPIALIAMGLAVAAPVAWAIRTDHLRAHWHAKYDESEKTVKSLTVAIGDATGGDNLKPADAITAVKALGSDYVLLKDDYGKARGTIEAMHNKTVELVAAAEQYRKDRARAIASRDDAVKRLKARALTPGDRADCVAQLKEAEASMRIAVEAGF